jgi:hypothetical protein
MAVVDDGRHVIAGSRSGIRVIDTDAGATVASLAEEELFFGVPQFSDSPRRLLTVGAKTALLRDLERPQAKPLSFGGVESERLFLGPRRLLLRSAHTGGTLSVWDLDKNENVGVLMRQDAAVTDVRFAPDERRALAVTEDGRVRVFDLVGMRPIGQPLPRRGRATVTRFSPDGRLALIGSDVGSVEMFSAEDGSPVGGPIGQPLAVRLVVMSDSGAFLVTRDAKNDVRLWDTRTGAQIGETIADTVDGGDTPCVPAFSRDERRLLLRLSRRAMQVIDTGSGRALGEPITHEGSQCGVLIGDGFEVLALDEGGTAHVVDLLARGVPSATLADVAETLSGYRLNAQGSRDVLPDLAHRRAGLGWLSARGSAERFAGSGPIRRTPMIGLVEAPPAN